MTKPVAVGVDGSEESMAAARWAAAEAVSRGVGLWIVCAQGRRPAGKSDDGATVQAVTAEETVRTAHQHVNRTYPDLDVTADVVHDAPTRVLLDVAAEAEVLVLGSRSLGALAGFFVGSVSLSVIAHTAQAVVTVRKPETPEAEGPAPVVVGLDTGHSYEKVLTFAFETAARRHAPLRVTHAWSAQRLYAYPSALPDPRVLAEAELWAAREFATALQPWRERFPGVEVEERRAESAAVPFLLEATTDASLVVVGRRLRGHPFPTRIGPVAHAILHHAPCPVAVVPHE